MEWLGREEGGKGDRRAMREARDVLALDGSRGMFDGVGWLVGVGWKKEK